MVDETYIAFKKVTAMLEERAKAPSHSSNRGNGGNGGRNGGGKGGKRIGHEQESAATGSQPESKKPKIDVEGGAAGNSATCEDGYCAPCYELC
jgi:hypothetical protein